MDQQSLNEILDKAYQEVTVAWAMADVLAAADPERYTPDPVTGKNLKMEQFCRQIAEYAEALSAHLGETIHYLAEAHSRCETEAR